MELALQMNWECCLGYTKRMESYQPSTGIIPGIGSANERRRYIVTHSLSPQEEWSLISTLMQPPYKLCTRIEDVMYQAEILVIIIHISIHCPYKPIIGKPVLNGAPSIWKFTTYRSKLLLVYFHLQIC